MTNKMDNNDPAFVVTDFLSELGLEKGAVEQNSWDSEVSSNLNRKENVYCVWTILT